MELSAWIVVLTTVLALLVLLLVLVRARRRAPQRGARAPSAVPTADGLRRGLLATRERLATQLDVLLGRGSAGVDRVLPALEEALVAADVGTQSASELVARVRARCGDGADGSGIRRALRDEVAAVLTSEPPPAPSGRPWVILVLGVNGVGKTTTIGKLAALHVAAGRRVLLVAADTFRAAAIEQLGVWAERTGADLVRQAPGGNPAAVVFDGLKAAVARQADVVLIDTAGRLHTRTNLMEELGKIRRVIAREVPDAPHETLLVLDATTGQNAIAQARTFAEAIGVTGIVLTKLDGTARGGVVIAIRKAIGVPIRYIGVGEAVEDLRPFDPERFADALFESHFA